MHDPFPIVDILNEQSDLILCWLKTSMKYLIKLLFDRLGIEGQFIYGS